MRGEIWTLQDDRYASKSRPVVVVQSDNIKSFDSVIICLLTTFDSSDIPTRVQLDPTNENGLIKTSYAMTDKIASVSKNMLGKKIGVVNDRELKAISQQLSVVLDLAS